MKRHSNNMNLLKVVYRFMKRLRVLHKYLLDSQISILKKLVVIGMLIYVFSPLDFLPDPILGFGFIDDAFIAIYVINHISNQLDKYLDQYEDKNKGTVIDINKKKIIDDVDYEVKDD